MCVPKVVFVCPECNSLPDVLKARRGWDDGWIAVQHVKMWSYSRFSAAWERSIAKYLERCLRSREKMLWKRWKQLLIFVSSARGGETAVGGAGMNMSSLSSVTHQLKSECSSKDFYFCCMNQFWHISGAFYWRCIFWKPLVNNLESIVRDFCWMTFEFQCSYFQLFPQRSLIGSFIQMTNKHVLQS